MNKSKRPTKLLTLDTLVRVRGGTVAEPAASPAKTADKMFFY